MNRTLRASARASLLAAALTFTAALPAFATVVTATGTYPNDAEPNNLATGFPNGPFGLTSGATTYSFVDFFPSQTFSLNNIVGLSSSFNDTAGGANVGAPRITVNLANGDFYTVYLGPAPNFVETNPAQFTTDYSGLQLDSGVHNSAFENTGSYTTFASLEAGADGSQIATGLSFILDAGFAGAQALTLNSLSVQFLAAPEPATWTMMAAALGLLGFLVARRRRNSAGAIAA